jgi:transcriptional regulator with XRE-family HTH domain
MGGVAGDSESADQEPVHAADLLGTTLRRAREERLLKLEIVARRAGLTASLLSRYERGRVSVAWPIFVRVLETMDLQPRLTVERRFADIDPEIDAWAEKTPTERIGGFGDQLSEFVEAFATRGVTWAATGATAAVLLGVPLTLRRAEIAVPDDALPEVLSALKAAWVKPDLPIGDPLRYISALELLQTRQRTPWMAPMARLDVVVVPRSALVGLVTVRVEDTDVPVMPLHALDLDDDETVRRTLDRVRARRSG